MTIVVKIIKTSPPDIAGGNEILYATTETVSSKSVNKQKKIERGTEHLIRELSIISEIQKGVIVNCLTCRKQKRIQTKDNIFDVKEIIKQSTTKTKNSMIGEATQIFVG